MQWEELKERAKELGAIERFNLYTGSELLLWKGLTFSDLGLVKQNDGSVLCKNKTPDEMYKIMEVLK